MTKEPTRIRSKGPGGSCRVDRSRPGSGTWTEAFAWSIPALVLVVFAVVIPVGILAWDAVDYRTIGSTLTDRSTLDAIRFSIWQALWSTCITMVLGTVSAWILARYEFRGRRPMNVLLTVPFVLPTVVVGAAFLALLPSSIERSTLSILLAHTFFNISVVIRLVTPTWSVIDSNQLAAARTLGASPTSVFTRVLAPSASSALTSAAGLVFLMSFTSYGVVRILGGPGLNTVEVEVYRRAVLLGDVSGAAVLAIAQTLVIVIVLTFVSRRPNPELIRSGGDRQPAPRWARCTAWAITSAVSLPLAAMVVRSLVEGGRWTLAGWSNLLFSDSRLMQNLDVRDAVIRSLIFAAIASLIAVPIGVAAAIGLTRRKGTGTRILLSVPIATSAVVVGFGILVAYDTPPFDVRSSWLLVPVTHAVVALPFVVRTALPVVQSIPRGLREAASVLGASPLRRWLAVDARLLTPAMATGLAMAFALSLGEFGATSFLTRRDTETLPILIDQLLSRTGGSAFSTAMAASTVLALLTSSVVVAFDSTSRT